MIGGRKEDKMTEDRDGLKRELTGDEEGWQRRRRRGGG